MIHRLFLGRFINAVAEEIKPLSGGRTLDFGCGEGFFLNELFRRGVRFSQLTGLDLREDALLSARKMFPEYHFIQADILSYNPSEGPFDLVIASQVLEHLPKPERFLEKLISLACGTLLLTVPLEPWFRLINLARGRDIRRFGNHPEHINHWGMKDFRQLVEAYSDVRRMYTVFPFLIVVVEKPVAGEHSNPGANCRLMR
ncbi:MAG: class I SAM-dependent methyltransferase [Acidobacteriota bacterium]